MLRVPVVMTSSLSSSSTSSSSSTVVNSAPTYQTIIGPGGAVIQQPVMTNQVGPANSTGLARVGTHRSPSGASSHLRIGLLRFVSQSIRLFLVTCSLITLYIFGPSNCNSGNFKQKSLPLTFHHTAPYLSPIIPQSRSYPLFPAS